MSDLVLYSVDLTEYVTMDPGVSVCLSVCVISAAQTDGPILMKLSTNHVSKTPPRVCCLKSGKSVDNFGSYGLPRFRKKNWTSQMYRRVFVESLIKIGSSVWAVEMTHIHYANSTQTTLKSLCIK